MSLVPNYGNSSEESSSEETQLEDKQNTEHHSDTESSDSDEPSTINAAKETPSVLPSASFLLGSGTVDVGVMKNPFKAAEDKKTATLERHVKMVDTGNNIKMKNGKKICWAYRKGRCRFGSACTFAHDSDLSMEDAQQSEQKKQQPTTSSTTGTTKSRPNKNKRPGLTNSIIPSKKAMKMYKDLK